MINVTLQGVYLENIARTQSFSGGVYAVSPNIFDIATPGYVLASLGYGYDPYTPPGISYTQELYSAKGSSSVILGTYFQTGLGLQTNLSRPLLIEVDLSSSGMARYTVLPLAFLDSAPMFTMSQYASVQPQDFLISIPRFVEVSAGLIDSVLDIPMSNMYIKLVPGISANDRAVLKAQLMAYLSYETLVDQEDSLQGVEQATTAMNLIFELVTIIALIIAFFSLSSSMFVNIFEQASSFLDSWQSDLCPSTDYFSVVQGNCDFARAWNEKICCVQTVCLRVVYIDLYFEFTRGKYTAALI